MHKTYLTAPTRGGHTYHSRNEPLCEYVTLYGFKEETFPIVIKKTLKQIEFWVFFRPKGENFLGCFSPQAKNFGVFPPIIWGVGGEIIFSPPIIWGVGGEKIFRSKSVSPPYGGENKYPWARATVVVCVMVQNGVHSDHSHSVG